MRVGIILINDCYAFKKTAHPQSSFFIPFSQIASVAYI